MSKCVSSRGTAEGERDRGRQPAQEAPPDQERQAPSRAAVRHEAQVWLLAARQDLPERLQDSRFLISGRGGQDEGRESRAPRVGEAEAREPAVFGLAREALDQGGLDRPSLPGQAAPLAIRFPGAFRRVRQPAERPHGLDEEGLGQRRRQGPEVLGERGTGSRTSSTATGARAGRARPSARSRSRRSRGRGGGSRGAGRPRRAAA